MNVPFLLILAAAIYRVLLNTAGAEEVGRVITNTASWFAEPGYAKTPDRWVRALTVGPSQYSRYAPTWIFLRNSLASDLLYTALFVGGIALSRFDAFHRILSQPRNGSRLGSRNLLLYQTTD